MNNSSPIDYSFMRTGNNNNPNKTIGLFDFAALLQIFMEDAIHISELYSLHNNIYLSDYIYSKGFKVRSIYETIFWNKNDTNIRVDNAKRNIINKINNDDNSILSDLLINETNIHNINNNNNNNNQSYNNNMCECEHCILFIDIDEKWIIWEPQFNYQFKLKQVISSFF